MADFSVCYEFKRKINKIGLMYKVSKNIKIFSFSLMIIGALGLAFSFYSAPKTIEGLNITEGLKLSFIFFSPWSFDCM